MDGSLDDVLFPRRDSSCQIDWQWNERVRLRVLRTLAEACAYMHSMGILHLDIKSSNVLLTQAAGQPGVIDQIRLADFGLSKVKSSMDASSNRRTAGTPGWKAPEVEHHADIGSPSYTTAADVWSFGILILVLLTRRPPPAALSVIKPNGERLMMSLTIMSAGRTHCSQGKRRLHSRDICVSSWECVST